MAKVNFFHIVLSIFLKYILYYVIFIVMNYDIRNVSTTVNLEGILYTVLILLPLPLINTLLFSIPLYYAFRIKLGYAAIIWLSVLVAEYYIFTRLTSQRLVDKYGLLNALISLAVLLIAINKVLQSQREEL